MIIEKSRISCIDGDGDEINVVEVEGKRKKGGQEEEVQMLWSHGVEAWWRLPTGLSGMRLQFRSSARVTPQLPLVVHTPLKQLQYTIAIRSADCRTTRLPIKRALYGADLSNPAEAQSHNHLPVID